MKNVSVRLSDETLKMLDDLKKVYSVSLMGARDISDITDSEVIRFAIFISHKELVTK